ncbi:MAG: DEAD/DEAH box helicase, partial [Fidelibacterota bacterium]
MIAISILQSFPTDVHFVLATEDSLNEKCFVHKKSRPFEINKHTSFDSLIDWLAAANYVLEGVVVQQGCFALRGGIVDVFPGTSDNPIRVNFLSEETEIFTFNIDSQLTEKRISSIKIPRIEEIEAGDQSFNEIYQEDIITIKILDEKTIIIGKEKKVDFEVDFPFNPLLLKDYLLLRENPNMIFKTDNHLTTVGFAHSPNSYLIPDWFQNRESPNLSPYSQDPASIIDFNKIEPGDILAHNDYGLCRYLGLKKNDGNGPEFILLEFDDNGMISLSMQMIRKLSFYASSNQPGISLDSLKRSGSWKRKKAGAENHADEIVDKLLMSYAERTSINRKIYQLDPEMEQVFLDGFPYSDTPDQKSVWDEISKDLSARNKPMNRLLCGDVGFGKTEIAIRAAFRSVYNGKQVGVLAPTTILANQLFSAFKARLSKFNISIEMVSRFRSKKEVDASLQNLAEGRLDIIIGTHSI